VSLSLVSQYLGTGPQILGLGCFRTNVLFCCSVYTLSVYHQISVIESTLGEIIQKQITIGKISVTVKKPLTSKNMFPLIPMLFAHRQNLQDLESRNIQER
jgi:hypothetical protein